MNFLRNMFFGSGSSQTPSSHFETTSQGPSFNMSRRSISVSTGSVDMTSSHGSSFSISGPNASVDLIDGGSINPMGTVKGNLAVNQNTSLGIGLSPMSKSTTIERKKENGVFETTLNVPFTPISLTKTSYQDGNPHWNAKSENDSQLHLNSELLISKQKVLQSIEATKNMMSPDVYQQQRSSTLSQIRNIEMDTQQRTQSASSSGGLFSFFKFW